MKNFLLCLVFSFIGIACLGQNVSDVVASQEGTNVVVSYYIDKASPSVQLTVSTDGGKTFSSTLKKVSGDIRNVQAGYRRIVWDVLSEMDNFSGNDIVFNVTAESLFGYVDLGLSVKWATCNLGSNKPEEPGMYFAWGDVTGQTWTGKKFSNKGFKNKPSFELDEKHNLIPEYDAAHVKMGGKWRMPTKKEMDELTENCDVIWLDNYEGTGVSGRIFRSRKPGYTDRIIFLPAVGYGDTHGLTKAGSVGYYWSSTHFSGDDACNLYFFKKDIGGCYTYIHSFNCGLSIRPICE